MDDNAHLARKVGAKRVAQHAEAQRAKGLARIAVWVPVADKDRLIAYAMRLRIGAELLLPSDRRTAALLRYGTDPAQEEFKTSAPGRAKQPPTTRGDEKPRRKRKRRTAAKPDKKAERKQEQNQPKTPKKKRNQRRRQEQKAARRMRG